MNRNSERALQTRRVDIHETSFPQTNTTVHMLNPLYEHQNIINTCGLELTCCFNGQLVG